MTGRLHLPLLLRIVPNYLASSIEYFGTIPVGPVRAGRHPWG